MALLWALFWCGLVLFAVGLVPNVWNFSLYVVFLWRTRKTRLAVNEGCEPVARCSADDGRELAARCSTDDALEALHCIPSFAVVVCARNEERVIGPCIASLKSLRYPSFTCFVVADNCEDSTAEIARKAGAVVLERFTREGASTKGDALAFFTEQLPTFGHFDYLCVFDSDSTVEPDFLVEMARAIESQRAVGAPASILVGALVPLHANKSLVSSLYTAYWRMEEVSYGRGHAACGLNALVRGTGFAVSLDALEDRRWNTQTMTEDVELYMHMALADRRIVSVPSAVCHDVQPATMRSMARQLHRWETGCLHVVRLFAQRAVACFIKKPCLRTWDTLMYLGELVSLELMLCGGLLLVAVLLAAPLFAPLDANVLRLACAGVLALALLFSLAVGASAVPDASQTRSFRVRTTLAYPAFLLAMSVAGVVSLFAPAKKWCTPARVCGRMRAAKTYNRKEKTMSNKGMQVSVHYTGTLDNGEKFDSSYDRNEPLTFVCMAGMMIPGFDKAVESMQVGETRMVHLPCTEAYGEYNPQMVQKIPLNQIPNGDQLPVGETVYFQTPYGPMGVKVVSIEDGVVTLDQNHELAGQDLNFEITLLEVTEAPVSQCGGGCSDSCCSSCGDGCC